MTDALGAAGIVPSHVLVASSRQSTAKGSGGAGRAVLQPRPAGGTPIWPPDGGIRPDPTGSRAAIVPLASGATGPAPMPTSVYGATKLAQEHILGAWCAANGSALSVLRLQNVYGPGQSLGNPTPES